MPRIVLGGTGTLARALAGYGLTFVLVAAIARAAIVAIGLPDWVFPGALIVMALGLPVILFTGYAHQVTKRLVTATPTLTPGGTSRPSLPRGTMEVIAVRASQHLSWRRTTMGGASAIGAFAVGVGALMLLRALGIGPLRSLLAAGKLARREPLLMTEFRVVHGDSTLGAVISQAVRSNLEQSSAVTLVPQSAVTLALQRMQRPANARLDLPLAQDLSAREGIKAIVDGEIDGIGSGYLLTLRLVSADSARELASFREAADGPKQLIDAVDVLSRKLRGRIGESLREVRASPPLAQVTTSSIDALRKYTAATQATGAANWASAIALARQAVAIDTGFALAYRHLAESIINARLPKAQSDSAITAAFRLRDRLTERERLAVIGEYYGSGPGRDRGKAIAAYETQAGLGEYNNTNSLGILLMSRREAARADSFGRMRVRVDPGFYVTYRNLVVWRLNYGNLTAAESALTLTAERFPASELLPAMRALILVARNDLGSATALLDSAQRTSGGQLRADRLLTLAPLLLLQGRIRDSDRLFRQARAVDSARGVVPTPIEDSLTAIQRDVWLVGPSATHVRRLDAIVTSSTYRSTPIERRPDIGIAEAYAFVGRADSARAALARYDAEVKDTARQRVEQPARHRALGDIALAEGRVADAVREFQRGDSLPDGPAHGCGICLYADLVRVYDAAKQPDSVIAMIERYVATPSGGREPIESKWPETRLAIDALFLAPFTKRLGEIYESKGDRARAAAYYQKFVDLWSTADPELQPRVREVRQRLAHLRDVEPRR